MAKTIYTSGEVFRICDYKIGHDQMLIRCGNVDIDGYNNIDIAFMGVFFVQIPTLFKGIEIAIPDDEELRSKFYYKLKTHKNETFYRITTQGEDYVVGALSCSIFLNDLEYNVTSLSEEGQNSRKKFLY